MKYKVRMLTRENAEGHPAAEKYFDCEFGHVLIVEDDKNWWYAKRFLEDLFYKNEKDFEIEIT